MIAPADAASLAWTKIVQPPDVPELTYIVHLKDTAQGDYVEHDVGDVAIANLDDLGVVIGSEYEAYVTVACLPCDPPRYSTASNHIVFTLSPPPQTISILSPPSNVIFMLP